MDPRDLLECGHSVADLASSGCIQCASQKRRQYEVDGWRKTAEKWKLRYDQQCHELRQNVETILGLQRDLLQWRLLILEFCRDYPNDRVTHKAKKLLKENPGQYLQNRLEAAEAVCQALLDDRVSFVVLQERLDTWKTYG